jgi:hypothetical protein
MQLMSHAAAISTSVSSCEAHLEAGAVDRREPEEAVQAEGVSGARENVVELKPLAAETGGEGGLSAEWTNQSLDGYVRAAMISAATAVIEPWLGANFGQAVERYLGGRVREIASEMVSRRLLDEAPVLVANQIGALEKRIGAAVMQHIATGIERALEPALSHQIVALEARMTVALGEQITKVLLKDLGLEIVRQLADAKAGIAESLPDQIAMAVTAEVRAAVSREVNAAEVRLAESLPLHVSAIVARDVPGAVSQQIAAVETQMAAALPRQVAAAVDQELGPAVESRVSVAEAQINAAMSRHIRTEIGTAFRRLADAG